MTKEQANEAFGHIRWQNEKFIVRLKEKGDELCLYVHRKNKEGVEELPRGYILGSNMLSILPK